MTHEHAHTRIDELSARLEQTRATVYRVERLLLDFMSVAGRGEAKQNVRIAELERVLAKGGLNDDVSNQTSGGRGHDAVFRGRETG